MGRNTLLFQEVVGVIHQPSALDRLEAHFHDRLLVDAGDTDTAAALTKRLRLDISVEERARVLNRLAETQAVVITMDQVEAAVYELFGNRFTEP